MDVDAAYHKLVRNTLNSEDETTMSPSKREYQRVLGENLDMNDTATSRILAFNDKAPVASGGHANNLKVLYSASKSNTTTKKPTRHIPQVPERILDAPEILNDYYLNLVDWSSNNHLAVALGSRVYIWNAISGSIIELMSLEGEYVCSLKWIGDGSYLAIGSSNGEVQLWDIEGMKRSRVMGGHRSRVSSLSWNQYIISSGARDGAIMHSDVRVANHMVSQSILHTQEVCGLTWSQDGRYLASGGNDNLVAVWEAAGDCYATGQPALQLTQHQAAVRALSWCPWQSNLLASGGGTNDRCIRTWNCQNGNMLSCTETRSQVCSLVWNSEYKEIVSSHGYPDNQIVIWKYPHMSRVAELTGHSERVLQLALSPDSTTLLSVGADETLRLWNCFPVDTKKKEGKVKQPVSALRIGIR